MTALDVSIAKAMVTLLEDGQPYSNEASVEYARDVEIKLENASSASVYVDATLSHERISRAGWSSTVTVTVIAVGPQESAELPGNSSSENEKDAWLSFIDEELISAIKSGSVSGKKPTAISFDQRLDPAKLREQSLFYTKFQVTFPLV